MDRNTIISWAIILLLLSLAMIQPSFSSGSSDVSLDIDIYDHEGNHHENLEYNDLNGLYSYIASPIRVNRSSVVIHDTYKFINFVSEEDNLEITADTTINYMDQKINGLGSSDTNNWYPGIFNGSLIEITNVDEPTNEVANAMNPVIQLSYFLNDTKIVDIVNFTKILHNDFGLADLNNYSISTMEVDYLDHSLVFLIQLEDLDDDGSDRKHGLYFIDLLSKTNQSIAFNATVERSDYQKIVNLGNGIAGYLHLEQQQRFLTINMSTSAIIKEYDVPFSDFTELLDGHDTTVFFQDNYFTTATNGSGSQSSTEYNKTTYVFNLDTLNIEPLGNLETGRGTYVKLSHHLISVQVDTTIGEDDTGLIQGISPTFTFSPEIVLAFIFLILAILAILIYRQNRS